MITYVLWLSGLGRLTDVRQANRLIEHNTSSNYHTPVPAAREEIHTTSTCSIPRACESRDSILSQGKKPGSKAIIILRQLATDIASKPRFFAFFKCIIYLYYMIKMNST
jgi:hypothetical protein